MEENDVLNELVRTRSPAMKAPFTKREQSGLDYTKVHTSLGVGLSGNLRGCKCWKLNSIYEGKCRIRTFTSRKKEEEFVRYIMYTFISPVHLVLIKIIGKTCRINKTGYKKRLERAHAVYANHFRWDFPFLRLLPAYHFLFLFSIHFFFVILVDNKHWYYILFSGLGL